MKTDATFPLPWEQVLWSSTPSFPVSWVGPGTQYALTDFRLVVNRNNRTVQELALDDIESVSLSQAWWQRTPASSEARWGPERRRFCVRIWGSCSQPLWRAP